MVELVHPFYHISRRMSILYLRRAKSGFSFLLNQDPWWSVRVPKEVDNGVSQSSDSNRCHGLVRPTAQGL